eukprot:jgi/Mesen1/4961/ME000248S04243
MAAVSGFAPGLASKIIAVGRNYAAHAKELGNAIPKEPFFFLKPASSFIQQGASIEIPPPLQEVHHEVELGVVIGKRGRDIPQAEALSYISGYALALDMTARELQAAAKAKGLPWTVAKGYDTFCPVSDFIPRSQVADPQALELWLKVDGVEKQRGSTSDMIFSIPFLISHISSIMTLEEGDLILTGTPEGVGPVKAGETITAGITGFVDISFPVKHR